MTQREQEWYTTQRLTIDILPALKGGAFSLIFRNDRSANNSSRFSTAPVV
jgi:hypothetical protein